MKDDAYVHMLEQQDRDLDELVRQAHVHIEQLMPDFDTYKAGADALHSTRGMPSIATVHGAHVSFTQWICNIVNGAYKKK